jgi:hypothetical protein
VWAPSSIATLSVSARIVVCGHPLEAFNTMYSAVIRDFNVICTSPPSFIVFIMKQTGHNNSIANVNIVHFQYNLPSSELPSSIMHSPRPSWTAIQHHALTSTLLDCHPASCTHLDPLGLPSSIMHSPRPSWTFSTRYTNAAAGATMAFAAEAADVLGLIPASLEEWRSKSGSMLIPTAVFCLTWPNASVKGETNESEQPRP